MRRKPPPPAPLPPDVRFMNLLSVAFGLSFVLIALALLVGWLMHLSMFGLSAISIQGDLTHNNAATLRASVTPRLSGNFFTVDLVRAKAVFESVPWVRHAVVQREFPNRLKVVLQEHQAIAYWGPEGDARLINNFGEIFEAYQEDAQADELPQLNGPQGQAVLVLQAYQMLAPLFVDKLGAALDRLELTGQGGWRARLNSGAELELGHGSLDEIQGRAQRFISTLAQVSARFGRELESADLRYSNGYAVRLRGVTTGHPADKDDKKAKR